MDARAGRYARAAGRWARLLTSGRPAPGVRVFYGWDRLPGAGEPAAGGTAKLQRLAARFPNQPTGFSLLYLAAPHFPRDVLQLVRHARRRGIPIVVNQNGVAYPAWAGAETDARNRAPRAVLRAAAHVLYQSAFCKETADLYLGPAPGPWEVLPNAVDVETFAPAAEPPTGDPVLLLAGDQTQGDYRVPLALDTLEILAADLPEARLLVTGRLPAEASSLIASRARPGAVELVGRYAQIDAPDLYRRAHVLLHTQVNDACPSVVIEAMACGVPVVHPASGGTVELVAGEAGIGVPHGGGYDRLEPPSPEQMAVAVRSVLADLETYRSAARRRAVEHYALGPWLQRHGELFAELVGP